jgi:hypothetical protein
MSRIFKMNGVEYEVPTDQAVLLSKYLTYAWDKLGKPNDIFTNSGRKLMDVIISAWEDTYPDQYYEWKIARDEHLHSEKTIHEQISQGTGRSLASIPSFVFHLIKKFFTANKPFNREFYIKLVREYPIFRYVNKI